MTDGPPFDVEVPDDGYQWWYVDGVSDDGRWGVTAIAFVGSVFSPRYLSARRRGPADPVDHCAFNVVLYHDDGRTWAMTEWDRARVTRSADELVLGTATLRRDADGLEVRFDERCAPLGGRLRGTVRVRPESRFGEPVGLDEEGRHRWWPIAPHARVEVTLEEPAVAFSGTGYWDANAGSEPLEASFATWSWSRTTSPAGTAVLYDVDRRSGAPLRFGRLFLPSGRAEPLTPPAACEMPRTPWGVARPTRGDRPGCVHPLRLLEDSPFYARTLVSAEVGGAAGTGVHEALDLDRFQRWWVQRLLPFRIRRGR